MAASLDGADLSAPCDLVTLTDDIPDIWIESLFDLKGTINPVHRAVVPSMYHAIVKDTVCASIWSNGKIIATGLGILDLNYIQNPKLNNMALINISTYLPLAVSL